MNSKLKELAAKKTNNCITIILNTHRTFPDSDQDPILLKNLIKEVESKLAPDLSKAAVANLLERLNTLADSIDHRLNKEALLLFVNEELADYQRLSIPVVNRTIVDSSFATRDLVRAMHAEANYYVLVLGRDEARFIEAQNDKVIQEVGAPFPIQNTDLSSSSPAEAANATRVRNLTAEFFNRVDKAVNFVRKDHPLPVLLCTEEENYHEYLKIADQKDSILSEFLNRSRQTEKDHAIVSDAWEIIEKIQEHNNNSRKEALRTAVSANKFLVDVNEINNAIQEGRVHTLFIEEGLVQAAHITPEGIELIDATEQTENIEGAYIEDIYDELIENSLSFGGDVVFLPQGELEKFNGFAAITRY
ncbi:hypothetical protein ACL9RF_13040 [Sphingobacterium sp. Mn56C]|uniref:AOC03_06830 family ribosome hibernation factor n=1 Tax=Sphingobacterium sp. Mn56C TaxID=3395261 RepID=UPI003BBD77E3